MKIAVPLTHKRLSLHFGHCEEFALIDVDHDQGQILNRVDVSAPPHQPGLLPVWLAEHGVNVVIAGGMGERARQLFGGHGIEVIIGAPAEDPEIVVRHFLSGTLEVGTNICDH